LAFSATHSFRGCEKKTWTWSSSGSEGKMPFPYLANGLGGRSLTFCATHSRLWKRWICNHSFAGSTIISSLWKRCVWSIEHNHYLPVKSSRVQPQLFSPTLFSLTFWLISNPSPGLSSLLSEPLLSHLLVDLQPFSGNLLSDDIRTIPSSSQTRDVCDQSSTVITSDFVVLSSNSSGRVLVT